MVGIAYLRQTMITSRQIRAARQLLGWHQTDLAKAAGVSISALRDIEREARDPRASTLLAIEGALKQAGIQLIDDSGGQGIYLARKH